MLKRKNGGKNVEQMKEMTGLAKERWMALSKSLLTDRFIGCDLSYLLADLAPLV